MTQLSLESNISVNNCWRWLVADADAFVQEPLRTLDEQADCSPKAPRKHSLQRNSEMWRQFNPIGKSKLLKVWNNLNPPPLYPAPPLPTECRWRKCAGKCCVRTSNGFPCTGAHAETIPLLKCPARKTFKCANTSCLRNANRPWNSNSLIYTNFQLLRPAGVPVTRCGCAYLSYSLRAKGHKGRHVLLRSADLQPS